MLKKLTAHIADPDNPSPNDLTITVLDEPDGGRGNHAYLISGVSEYDNHPRWPDLFSKKKIPDEDSLAILFQQGPIQEVGVNGVTIESLLEVCIHRLTGLQSGPHAHSCNRDALDSLIKAQDALHRRTLERRSLGTEGTSEV